jgi:MoxR-like ATPase
MLQGTTMKELAHDLQRKLDAVGYFISEQEAFAVAIWLEERREHLTVEGPPGAGKTSLVYALARIFDAPVERLECNEESTVQQSLYGWDEKLQNLEKERAFQLNDGVLPDDPSPLIYKPSCLRPGVFMRAFRNLHPHTFVLINEIDKVPQKRQFEATFLQVIEEHSITIVETGEQVVPATGTPPHVVVTSNAGTPGASERESLSYPLLRRGGYLHLPEPDRERRYELIRQKAPKLPPMVARECALFLERAKSVGMQKPISTSEGISWVRTLELFLPFTTLTHDLIATTIFKLAKSERDRERLRAKIQEPLLSFVAREKALWRPAFLG